MTNEQLWQATLGELELLISKVHFTTWFRNTFIIDWAGNKVVVAVPNNFTKAWLESKYHRSILQVLQNITENGVAEIEYRVDTGQRVDSIRPAGITFAVADPAALAAPAQSEAAFVP